jgi:hypothetical protein
MWHPGALGGSRDLPPPTQAQRTLEGDRSDSVPFCALASTITACRCRCGVLLIRCLGVAPCCLHPGLLNGSLV